MPASISRGRLSPFLIIGALALVAALLVAVSLRRPEVPTYTPSASQPRDVGEGRVGPVVYTVDASAEGEWKFFDFSKGSVVPSPGPGEWDVAFRRFNVISNGGEGFAGRAGALDLGEVDFGAVAEVPQEGYQPTVAGRDTINEVFQGWYDYGFTTHLLSPKPRVYAVRTADGRYAKLEFLSYYCPGAQPGCLTFRYVYQGDGSRVLAGPDGSGP